MQSAAKTPEMGAFPPKGPFAETTTVGRANPTAAPPSRKGAFSRLFLPKWGPGSRKRAEPAGAPFLPCEPRQAGLAVQAGAKKEKKNNNKVHPASLGSPTMGGTPTHPKSLPRGGGRGARRRRPPRGRSRRRLSRRAKPPGPLPQPAAAGGAEGALPRRGSPLVGTPCSPALLPARRPAVPAVGARGPRGGAADWPRGRRLSSRWVAAGRRRAPLLLQFLRRRRQRRLARRAEGRPRDAPRRAQERPPPPPQPGGALGDPGVRAGRGFATGRPGARRSPASPGAPFGGTGWPRRGPGRRMQTAEKVWKERRKRVCSGRALDSSTHCAPSRRRALGKGCWSWSPVSTGHCKGKKAGAEQEPCRAGLFFHKPRWLRRMGAGVEAVC